MPTRYKEYIKREKVDVISIYASQLSKFPDLKSVQSKLVPEVQKGSLEAKTQLLQSSLKYTLRFCQIYAPKFNLNLIDLIGELNIKVIKVIEEGLHNFKSQSQFSTYLYRTLKNVAIIQVRRTGKTQNPSLEELSEKNYDFPDNKTKTPADLTVENEDLSRLERALKGLNNEEQEFVNNLFFSGISIDTQVGKNNPLRCEMFRQRRRILEKLRFALAS